MTDKILTRDDILKADDVEYATVPGFKEGEVFRLGSLNAGDIIEWSEANEGEAKRTAGLRLIIKSVVNAEGKTILSDEDIVVLRAKSHKVTERLVREILKLNGMNVKDPAAAAKKD